MVFELINFLTQIVSDVGESEILFIIRHDLILEFRTWGENVCLRISEIHDYCSQVEKGKRTCPKL